MIALPTACAASGTLPGLPCELISEIVAYLEEDVDMFAFRLLCRELYYKNLNDFARHYFRWLNIHITEKGLQRLMGISRHPVYALSVSTLQLMITTADTHFLSEGEAQQVLQHRTSGNAQLVNGTDLQWIEEFVIGLVEAELVDSGLLASCFDQVLPSFKRLVDFRINHGTEMDYAGLSSIEWLSPHTFEAYNSRLRNIVESIMKPLLRVHIRLNVLIICLRFGTGYSLPIGYLDYLAHNPDAFSCLVSLRLPISFESHLHPESEEYNKIHIHKLVNIMMKPSLQVLHLILDFSPSSQILLATLSREEQFNSLQAVALGKFKFAEEDLIRFLANHTSLHTLVLHQMNAISGDWRSILSRVRNQTRPRCLQCADMIEGSSGVWFDRPFAFNFDSEDIGIIPGGANSFEIEKAMQQEEPDYVVIALEHTPDYLILNSEYDHVGQALSELLQEMDYEDTEGDFP